MHFDGLAVDGHALGVLDADGVGHVVAETNHDILAHNRAAEFHRRLALEFRADLLPAKTAIAERAEVGDIVVVRPHRTHGLGIASKHQIRRRIEGVVRAEHAIGGARIAGGIHDLGTNPRHRRSIGAAAKNDRGRSHNNENGDWIHRGRW